MMHTLVGREGFRRGMDLYFQRHDGQAVTCDDFAQAIADANPGSWLAEHLEAFKRWYSQAGTPILLAHGHYDAERAATRCAWASAACPRRARAQAAVRDPGGAGAAGARRPAAEAAPAGRADGGRHRARAGAVDVSHTFTFVDIDAEPVPSLLRGFSAPVQLSDDAMSDADLRVLLQHDTDAFNRWEAGQRLLMQTMVAALPAGSAPQLDSDNVEALRTVLRDPRSTPR